jgi:hypothetical protein
MRASLSAGRARVAGSGLPAPSSRAFPYRPPVLHSPLLRTVSTRGHPSQACSAAFA